MESGVQGGLVQGAEVRKVQTPGRSFPGGLGRLGLASRFSRCLASHPQGNGPPSLLSAEAASWPVQGVTGSVSCGVCRNLLSGAPEPFSWGSWARLFTPLHGLCPGSLGALEKRPSRAAVIDFPCPSTQLTEPPSSGEPCCPRVALLSPDQAPSSSGRPGSPCKETVPIASPSQQAGRPQKATPGQEGTHREAMRIPKLPGLRRGLPPALPPSPSSEQNPHAREPGS